MILLVSASPRAVDCARAIDQAVCRTTLLCPDTSLACALSRSGEFRIIVFDEATVAVSSGESVAASRNGCGALCVHINTGLMDERRIVKEVRAAMARVDREREVAISEAGALLRNELNNEITGVLLAAGLALSAPGIPPFAVAKIRDIQQLANRMRCRFAAYESARIR